MFNEPPKPKDFAAALKALDSIPRPDTDNEGQPINSPSVLPFLSPEHQEQVHEVVDMGREVLTKPGDTGIEPNNRNAAALRKLGVDASVSVDQYDPMRIRGHAQAGVWPVDLSDPPSDSNDSDN